MKNVNGDYGRHGHCDQIVVALHFVDVRTSLSPLLRHSATPNFSRSGHPKFLHGFRILSSAGFDLITSKTFPYSEMNSNYMQRIFEVKDLRS